MRDFVATLYIIAITKTWVTPLNSGPYNNLDNYIIVQNPRQNLKGGGVAFYMKNNLQSTVIDELSFKNEKVFESIFVKIELNMILLHVAQYTDHQ